MLVPQTPYQPSLQPHSVASFEQICLALDLSSGHQSLFLPSGETGVIISRICSAPFLKARHHLRLQGKTKQTAGPTLPRSLGNTGAQGLSLEKLSLHFNKTCRCLICTLEGQTGGLKERRSNQLAVAGLIPRGRNGNSLKIVF